MSIIIEFFTAPDDVAAASIVEGGPEGIFETVQYGNFDAMTALAEWDSILTGRELDVLISADVPRVVVGDDGPFIFAASAELQAALAEADPVTLPQVADRWIELQGEDAHRYDGELFGEMLQELASLARTAGHGHGLYCWMC